MQLSIFLRPFIAFLLLITLLPGSGRGQYYNFQTYSVANGLSQSQNESIFEDSKGYLWFGAYEGGISRYDGYSFQTYTTTDGLLSNMVRDIRENSFGELVISTSYGISLYNGSTFTIVAKGYNTGKIAVDEDNNIYAISDNGLLYVPFANGYDTVKTYFHQPVRTIPGRK